MISTGDEMKLIKHVLVLIALLASPLCGYAEAQDDPFTEGINEGAIGSHDDPFTGSINEGGWGRQ